MNVLIIEDELAIAKRLQKLIEEIDPEIKVLASIESVESSIKWFQSNPHPDLIFQDIHLADGSGFEIYQQVNIDVPVIFTTAYHQYAIDAFKLNSIDYLLKPIKKDQLKQSIEKFKKQFKKQGPPAINYAILSTLIAKESYQKRFMVRYGQKLKVIETDDIAYFYTLSGNLFFKTFDNNEYPVDFSLDKLENMLDPDKFYRINRQFIIQMKAIKEMYAYSKSRVKIDLDPPCEIESIASTERSGDFKKWLSGLSY
ncbi:MAG: LytTR family DNA-binding domain-containing protein [Bacteroidales bacterium]|nr:LytTR family DNA-binding domain-containing protein [Bacteroidales bacterium]MCF8403136.1 LytTR family DNA-binding domain-containing protein [Bacteroidales bacterium]